MTVPAIDARQSKRRVALSRTTTAFEAHSLLILSLLSTDAARPTGRCAKRTNPPHRPEPFAFTGNAERFTESLDGRWVPYDGFNGLVL
jgi:hypothetical protein